MVFACYNCDMGSVIYSVILGIIAGVLWGLTFSATAQIGGIWGGVIGLILALLLGFFAKAARVGTNLVKGETSFVNNSLISLVGIAAILFGAVALGISYVV